MNISNHLLSLKNLPKKLMPLRFDALSIPVIKNFLIYACGSIMLRGMSIILAPILLTVLNPQDYGLLSLVTSFNNILIAFLGLGLRQVFYIQYFHCNPLERKQMSNSILILYILLAVPILALFSMHISFVDKVIFDSNASHTTIKLCMLYCFVFFPVELFYQHLQYACKALSLTLLQTMVACCTLALTIFFLYNQWHIYGIMCGNIGGMLIVILIGMYYFCRQQYWTYFSWQHLRSNALLYLYLGIPFIPSILFAWMLSSGDKWVLTHYATLHDVGIYAIADAFSQLFYLVVLYPLSGSYLPWLLNQFAENKDNIALIEKQNKTTMYYCMIGMTIIVSVCFVMFKPLFFKILPSHYHESIQYIWLILVGNIFLMGTYFTSALIQFHKKTYFLALALCIPACANIGLNILLIPFFDIYGCVSATLLSYIGYFLLVLWYNKRLLKHIAK